MKKELIIVYLFVIYGLIQVVLNKELNQVYFGLVLFISIKIFFNYRKCTISYLECKLRNVKKEEGYLNQLLDGIIDLRYSINIIPINIMIIIIIFYRFILQQQLHF